MLILALSNRIPDSLANYGGLRETVNLPLTEKEERVFAHIKLVPYCPPRHRVLSNWWLQESLLKLFVDGSAFSEVVLGKTTFYVISIQKLSGFYQIKAFFIDSNTII